MSEIYNIISVVLALVGILIPVVILFRSSNNMKITKIYFLSICSMFLCMGALFCQFCSYNVLINSHDFTALLDISSVIMIASGVVVIVTLLLNMLVFIKAKRNGYKTIFY